MDVGEEQEGYAAGPPAVSLIEISRVLEETARLIRLHAGVGEAPQSKAGSAPVVAASRVRAIIAAHWLRREFLGCEASDAEWRMMLELYAARLEGRSVYQTRLAVASGVPQTTALNAARRLLETGVFIREAHPKDKRLLVIALSGAAADRIGTYLAAATRIAPILA